MRVQIRSAEQVEEAQAQAEQVKNVEYQHPSYTEQSTDDALAAIATTDTKPRPNPFVKPIAKVGRNEPCPCGSGKKYKQCHGQLT